MFSASEVERYARHLVLRDVGGPGQQKLKAARVLVIGAGGLGSPVIQYLAAAGVGEIGILDDDVVSLSNLQRQVIYTTDDIGKRKADCAAVVVQQLNPHVKVTPLALRLDADNAREIVAGWDVVADGSDNFATRYALSDACFYESRPLVTAAIGTFDGSLTTLRPFEMSQSGAPNPTYRCLFPEPPPPGSVPTCEEAGVIGALAGTLGSLMAHEIIREIVGFGEGLVGRLMLVDMAHMRFESIAYGWDRDNPLNGITAKPKPIGTDLGF
ncbi:MAG: molybdopterin-synthase adenylyltransferase MoeB [Methylovirgula sp.]|uniref:HesA/MoeB/ThiF family protein n=1 Tax=Methylovirgula sp. TaxID=1978224 RepID=UPI0030763BD4